MKFSLVRALVKHSLKHIGDAAGCGVVPIGSIASGVYDDWCASEPDSPTAPSPANKPAALRYQIEHAAQDPAGFRKEIELELYNTAPERPEAEKQAVLTYLQQVPGRVQASLRRPEDPTGKTFPTSLSLRKAEDLLPFLPERLPRFKPGDGAVPGTDLVVQELLGVGGFGEVWKAVHRSRPHLAPVALKFCTSEAAARSLRKEVELLDRVAGQGRHKGIVELRYAHLEGETPCLEYEYIDGGDLGGLIAELHATGKATPEAAAYVILSLAQAIGFAHRLTPPIVHRDLKPANILTTRVDGKIQLKVADFGIGGIAAEQAIQDWAGSGNVSTGRSPTQSVGSCTPLYASAQQRRFGLPDPRDDVYALGVIWYQILCGDTTKEAPRGGAWKKRLADQGVKDEMVALIERCMEDDPGERPADAHVLAEELKAMARPAAAAPVATVPVPSAPPPVAPAPAPTVAPGPPPLPKAAATGRSWFYLRAGQRVGPVTEDELRALIAGGTVERDEMVWATGFDEWAEAKSVKGLCPPRASAPPPAPKKKVSGRVVVNGQMFNGVMWFKISVDGNVLGESRVISGCDFAFESTVGEHVVEVNYSGALMATKTKTFKVTFEKTGSYRVTMKPTMGFLGMNPSFTEPEVIRTGD